MKKKFEPALISPIEHDDWRRRGMHRAEKLTYLTAAIATAEVLYALYTVDPQALVAGILILATSGSAILSF